MVSAKHLFRTRSKAEGATFLKYSSLPFGTRELKTSILDVRPTPKLNSPAVVDIRNQIECDGKTTLTDFTSIPLNFTNLRKLSELIGDDLTAARNMVLVWRFKVQPNPNARAEDDAEVMGFVLESAEQPKRPEPEPAAKSNKTK